MSARSWQVHWPDIAHMAQSSDHGPLATSAVLHIRLCHQSVHRRVPWLLCPVSPRARRGFLPSGDLASGRRWGDMGSDRSQGEHKTLPMHLTRMSWTSSVRASSERWERASAQSSQSTMSMHSFWSCYPTICQLARVSTTTATIRLSSDKTRI